MRYVKPLSLTFFFCILFSILCVSILGEKLDSVLLNYLNLEVERVTANVIDSAVNEVLAEGIDEELFVISKNDNNEIEMIDYDTQKVNILLKRVNEKIYEKLKLLEEGNLENFSLVSSLTGAGYKYVENGVVCEIPLGALMDNAFFANLGPVIPIKMSFLGQVNSSLKTKVTSYGINNLYLELSVVVEVKERISLPKSSNDVIITNTAPLNIKIISGVVPDYYGGVIDKNSQASFFVDSD